MGSSKFAEAGNIDKLIIHSHEGKSIDVSGGVANLFYYESVLENCVKATVVIADTGYGDSKLNNLGIIAGLPIRGGEKVYLKFSDLYGNQIEFDNDVKPFYINRVRDKFTDGTKTVFTIDLCTREYLYNEFVENLATSKYSGKISDTVRRILIESLKTKKQIYVDETLNSEVIYGNHLRPLELCTELATHSIPSKVSGANGKIAGYFLYENRNGMFFKSIDKLLEPPSASGLYKYIHTGSDALPSGYTGLISKFEEHIYIDLQDQMRRGTWGFKTEIFDYLQEKDQDTPVEVVTSSTQQGVAKLATGPKSKYQNLGEFSNVATKRVFGVKDSGINVDGINVNEQLQKSKDENFKTSDIIAQSKMRYNQLFTIKVDVIIPGNYDLYAGRLIQCDFKPTSSQINVDKDERLSGIYMIADLCHRLDPKETYTKLTLVRETYGGTNP